MNKYKIEDNESYNAQVNYGSNNTTSSYGGQNQNITLPIYSENNNKSIRKSKCPRGAPLGSIGTCCGLDCTRGCAIED